jgi:hypothetical protein
MHRIVLLCLALGACGHEKSAPQPKEKSAGEIIAKCVTALQVGSSAAERAANPEEARLTITRACGPLFKKQPCRDAWSSQLDTSLHGVIGACARAYCSELAAPQPSACDGIAGSPAEQAVQWGDLQAAIHRHDWGAKTAADFMKKLSALEPEVAAPKREA